MIMERFANWSELPAKKQEVLERKLFLWKRNDDGAQ